jgi:rhamnogalacturonan acetylesterase
MKIIRVFCVTLSVCMATAAMAAEPNVPVEKKTPEKPSVRNPDLPALFLVGDSTVHNSKPGSGWGDHIEPYFDTSKIGIYNRARGGRSSRSYIEEGLWQQVLREMKAGDYVMLQMGHNDGGGVPSRLSLPGIGEETQDVNAPSGDGTVELHTYGWYLRKYITDTRQKGATIILVTPVLSNTWDANGVNRNKWGQYAYWMRQVAQKEKTLLLDLNKISQKHYAELGQAKVSAEFYGKGDITHTVPAGAKANASYVIEGLGELKGCKLADFLKKPELNTTTK